LGGLRGVPRHRGTVASLVGEYRTRVFNGADTGASRKVNAMTKPTRRERLRPLELLAIAGVLAIFTGLVVLMATREPILAVVFLGIAFIVSLVVLAMLALAVTPTGDEQADLDEQDGMQRLGEQDRGDIRRNRGH
jgi:undecaprenyl pyrophosphate phosphatase UppP